MNGIAILTNDEHYRDNLLRSINELNITKSSNRLYTDSESSRIVKQAVNLYDGPSSAPIWIFRMFNNTITIDNGKHEYRYSVDCETQWSEDLFDFLNYSNSRTLNQYYREDVENKNITNEKGGEINEYCGIRIKKDSKLKNELENVYNMLKEKKISSDELPSYIDNCIICY